MSDQPLPVVDYLKIPEGGEPYLCLAIYRFEIILGNTNKENSVMSDNRLRAIGINHVALEVGDIDEALEFYGKLFDVDLLNRSETDAFIGLGDQFIALFKGGSDARDTSRHFGLVVDDPAKGRAILEALGVALMPGRGVNFNDPWGNYVQLVTYEKIQFDKTPGVLRAMGIDDLEKTEAAKAEIADKGFAD